MASPEVLAQRGVEVFESDRGGDVTFHGPGQLVGYPIFDLRAIATPDGKRKTLGAIDYVRRLEEVLIRTCADFGIPTTRICGLTGVWTTPETMSPRAEQNNSLANCSAESRDPASTPRTEAKIAAIGVHISRAVTSHGFALNVNTDLDYFNLIIPCGITTKPVTSMAKELGKELSLQEVAHSISRNFGVVFESQMLWLESLDALLGQSVGVPLKPPGAIAPAAQRRRYIPGMTNRSPETRHKPSLRVSMDVAEPLMAKKQDKRLAAKSPGKAISSGQRTYTIPDHRLEKPNFTVRQVRKAGKVATKSPAISALQSHPSATRNI